VPFIVPDSQLPFPQAQVGSPLASAPPANEEIPAGLPTATSDHPPVPDIKRYHALIATGQTAFNNACTACHDADKALSKRKSLAQWQATVQRMAAKDGADVPARDVEAIATYLASLSVPASDGAVPALAVPATADGAIPGVEVYGTLSPTFRGGNENLQNGGFFPDVWLGVGVQTASPLSGRVTSCISCHTEPGEGSRIELVEAALRLDLIRTVGRTDWPLRAWVDAGRFVVPFGAFAQQSNPGVYRTVTKPLIYNMGFRVFDGDLGDPVLPMPYADEGASINLATPLWADVTASWDAYAINGLQGTADGIDFDLSRDYVDNNARLAGGTRLTIGNPMLRLGSSFMTGDAAPAGGVGPNHDMLFYRVYGFDATFRYQDLVRCQFEYARRDSDRIVSNPGPLLTRDHVEGCYLEAEVMLWRAYGISFLMRYDRQARGSIAPPPDSSLTVGSFAVNRMTYGFNFRLPGGSVLMVDYEHWSLPDPLKRADLVGARWVYSF
jgi:hypothetical protein